MSNDLTPDTRRYCRFDIVGRVSWTENLQLGPSGDCAGPLYNLFGEAGDVCERHYLQLNGEGVKFPVVVVKS